MSEPVIVGGRYRLGRLLGRGGMSTVHEAEDAVLRRRVAVKLFAATGGPDAAERLQREARLIAGLDHPNLVAAYDAGVDPAEGAWIALELVPGPDLAALLRERGRLPGDEVRRIVRDIAAALEHIHARDVVHRDLKPANILLTAAPDAERWQAKLADFGIARLLEDERMTSTGVVVGTAAYLSPEQVRGDRVGTASDVYSLGLVAVEALTGRRPFPGSAVESATARLVRGPEVPSWLGEPWISILTAMTATDPRGRPSAAQLLRVTEAPFPTGVTDEETAPMTAAVAGSTESTAATAVRTALLDPVPAAAAVAARRRPGARTMAVGAIVLTGLVAGGGALLAAAPALRAAPAATSTTPAARPVSSTPSVTPHAVTTSAPATARRTAVAKTTSTAGSPARAVAPKGHGSGKAKGRSGKGGHGKH